MILLGEIAPPRVTALERIGATWVKLEGGQPAGSVKQRLVHARLTAALERGELSPRRPLAEVSAGSTGVALAYAGAQLGLPVEIHVLEDASPVKTAMIEAHGARLVRHPLGSFVPGLVDALRSAHARGEIWHLDQYDRTALIRAYRPLAAELLAQLAAQRAVPGRFLCPIGTGGLIQGVGAVLREAFPAVEVIAVEPAPRATIDGIRNTEQCHGGAADPYDRDFPDARVEVPAPVRKARLADGRALGDSATACLRLALRSGWIDAVIVAAD